MIIYNPRFIPYLLQFGIEVPHLKSKYDKIVTEITKDYSQDVFYQGQFEEIKKEDLLLAHDESFVRELLSHPEEEIIKAYELIKTNGQYHRYNPSKATRSLHELAQVLVQSTSGTYQSLVLAQEKGFSYFLGGGQHHAMSFGGRGFCLVNDIVITLRKFLSINKKLKKAWVIDVDAHKGCGTAQITQNDEKILTLSIHMADGWPLDSTKYDGKGELYPWFIESNIDIPIQSGQEHRYIKALEEGVEKLFAEEKKPDIVLIVNGSDPYEFDTLPSADLIKLTKEELFRRDVFLYDYFKKKNIPQAYVASGGYGEKVWEIHYQFIHYALGREGHGHN